MEEVFDEKESFNAKKEIVLSLGIYELRELGRSLGIQSPTTKKREELLSLVFSALENNKDISQIVKKQKKGRPSKKISSLNGILEAISGEEEHLIKDSRISTFEDLVVFNQEFPSFQMQSSDVFPSCGVLRKGKSFGYFIDCSCQRIIYLSLDQVSKYKLQTGDFVECAVFEINNGSKCFVKKILKVNGINVENYNLKEFFDYEQVLPTIKEIDGKNVCLGGRNVLVNRVPLFMNLFVSKIMEFYKGKKVAFLGTNLCFEDKNFIKNSNNIFSFTSNYSDRITDGYDRILDAINFVLRLDNLNEEVLLLVNDFATILNALDSYFVEDETSTIFAHKEKTIVVAKKLISLAKAKNNGQNVTVMILCNCNDTEDAFIKSELIKISNIVE